MEEDQKREREIRRSEDVVKESSCILVHIHYSSYRLSHAKEYLPCK